jgi:ElaB/YqjD/DUF883 family membrane-anchored ribosome-binding protein
MPTESTPFPTSSEAGTDSMAASGRVRSDNETDTALGARATRVDDVIGRIAQSAHETIDRLAETAAPHVSRLGEGLSGAGETLQARADRAREMGDEWVESLRDTVRENPLAAVGVALAIGVLVARLSR